MLEVVTHARNNSGKVIISDCLQLDAYNISNYGEGKRNKE